MGRRKFMVSTYSEIALEHFQLMREDFQQLQSLESMCGEVMDLKKEMQKNCVVCITFAAMAVEAFLNDYAATRMGDRYFSDNFEQLRPFAKLDLISNFEFHKRIETGGMLQNSVGVLSQDRNKLVHSKTKEARGMTQEEYEQLQHLRETDEDFRNWELASMMKIHLEEEKKMFDHAHMAVRALKEVADYIDAEDALARAAAKLLRSGVYVGEIRGSYAKIREAQLFLGARPLMDLDNE